MQRRPAVGARFPSVPLPRPTAGPIFPRSRPAMRFTLLEMVIAVAVILVLAAIAIPELSEMRLEAKVAELTTNVEAIRDAEIGYLAANDAYVDVPTYNPPGPSGKTPVPWPLGTPFDDLGWRPDGD